MIETLGLIGGVAAGLAIAVYALVAWVKAKSPRS
jgi:hypothetical protein